ncbi:hypothetical protein SAMN02745857_00091 [Andreprevotia lacus DSM 23236]|jgi:hypothetical protein|uniref:Uncharacterized protein n=1 Tax=Andreprevotia lacus DSM 23236 TaxID=1121001 RepID=A0A1W1WXC0_9NEIS|nr:hypothetical protein [Andreprevotia lacus]SMC16068.1 hypothetical protein SAMN02745857_00091 [Andreprevotia lacus DSM 23236]
MKRIIELQGGPDHRLVRQLATLAAESATLCSIVSFAPQTLVARAGWGASVNVLIVQDENSYLLRGGRLSMLREMSDMLLETGRPAFFVPRRTIPLNEWAAEEAARFLIALPPVLLASDTLVRMRDVAQPMHGEMIDLISPVQQRALA